MPTTLRRTLPVSILLLLLLLGTAANQPALAQEVGGPYTEDENTIVLLHFDGDLSNSSEAFDIADPIGSGQLADAETDANDFITDSRLPSALGQQVFVNNQSSIDSTYISIPDTADLDLTGDWTMEYWVNIFSYGTSNEDHNFHPRVLMKRGNLEDDPSIVEANFWNNMNGNVENFITGYHTHDGNVNIGSPSGMFEPNNWYHVAFIRDTTKQYIAQLIHRVDNETNELELIHFQTESFGGITAPPVTNDGSLFIGGFPDIASSWLNGALDELRISNVVRNFEAPPIVSSSDLPNQEPGSGPYDIVADVTTLGDATLTDVTLYYDLGSGFQSVAMTPNDTAYAAQIPDQPAGTTVLYYVSATTDQDLTATAPASSVDTDTPENFFDFAIVEPESQVLHLTFEEGSGTPVDHSAMGHDVQVFGNQPPTYSTDAVEGDYSLQFSAGDSSYLMIDPSPGLASEEFTIDFWFNVDSVTTGGRYIVKQGGEGVTNEPFHVNYKIFTFGSDQSIRAASWQNGGGLNGGQLDPDVVPETGQWYRAVYYMSADTAYFQMRTEAGAVAAEAGYSSDALPGTATNGPFFIGFATEPGSDYFIGKMDDIKIYNYPVEPEGVSVEGVTKYVGTQAEDDAPYAVSVDVSGGQGVSAALYYSIDGGETFEEASMSAAGNTYTGEIPEQAPGTIVEYYVAVEDDAGSRITRPILAASDDPEYYHFGVGETAGMTLHLTFEEGSGIPQNQGLYDLPIEIGGVNGPPTYSEDAIEGSYSLQFTQEDSSYLRIDPAPFLSSDEFLLDFWFKPDGPMEPQDRLIVKQGGEGITAEDFHINYKVFALGGDAPLRAASWQRGGELNGGNLDTGVAAEADQWYRAVYYMSADTAYFTFLAEDGTVVAEAGYSADALPATATYGPFYIGISTEPGTDYFNGKVDDVKFFNYARTPEGVAIDDDPVIPAVYELAQNYPNPAHGNTTIEYALPQSSEVRIEVFDLLGRRVATLVDQRQSAGRHDAEFDARHLGSGVYFYRLQADDVVKTRKMTLIR